MLFRSRRCARREEEDGLRTTSLMHGPLDGPVAALHGQSGPDPAQSCFFSVDLFICFIPCLNHSVDLIILWWIYVCNNFGIIFVVFLCVFLNMPHWLFAKMYF